MNVFWYSLLSWCLSSGACYSTGNTMMVSKDVSVSMIAVIIAEHIIMHVISTKFYHG